MQQKIFILLLLIGMSGVFAEKQYPLVWRFSKGLHNIVNQKVKISNIHYLQDTEEKVFGEKAQMTTTIHWKVENIINNYQALVTSIVHNGKLKLETNDKKYTLNMRRKADRAKRKDPKFVTYSPMISDGVAFLLDVKKRDVLVTWDMLLKDDGTYERKMFKGAQDPRDMSFAYKQLANKVVPIGYKWKVKRKSKQFRYKYNFEFVEVRRYKDRPVAKVVFNADLMIKKQKIGSVEGYFYHDYKRHLMMFFKMKELREQKYTQKNKNYLAKISLEVVWKLSKTNANPNIK